MMQNTNIIDLSGAEGNIAVDRELIKKIANDLSYINTLPDKNLRQKVHASIAMHYGVKADNLLLGNGSDEIIETIADIAKGGSKAIAIAPTFSRLIDVNTKHGINIDIFSLDISNNFQYDDDTHKSFLEFVIKNNPDFIWFCSPSNPTGTIIQPHYILEISKIAPSALIIVDEVFIDFNPLRNEISAVNTIEFANNIIVLNSMSKSWGLAGLRIGWAIGGKAIIDNLRSRQIMYNINSLALNGAEFILENTRFRDNEIKNILHNRHKLLKYIKNNRNLDVISNSETNLLCIRAKDRNLFDELMKYKIRTKDLSKSVGLEDYEFCRVLIPRLESDVNKVIDALNRITG